MNKGPGLLRRHLLRRTPPAKICQSASCNIDIYIPLLLGAIVLIGMKYEL